MRLELDRNTGRLAAVGGTTRASGASQRAAADALEILLAALLADHDRRIALGEQPDAPSCSVPWDSQGDVVDLGQKAGLGRDPTVRAVRDAVSQGLILMGERPKGRNSSGARLHVLSAEGLARARAVDP